MGWRDTAVDIVHSTFARGNVPTRTALKPRLLIGFAARRTTLHVSEPNVSGSTRILRGSAGRSGMRSPPEDHGPSVAYRDSAIGSAKSESLCYGLFQATPKSEARPYTPHEATEKILSITK